MLNSSFMRSVFFVAVCIFARSVTSAPSYSTPFSLSGDSKQPGKDSESGVIASNDATAGLKDDQIITVVGKGVGIDKENALKDAYRDAIERAVGMYVDAEQMMKNGELVQDRILTFSNAYIERFDVKEEKKESNGLFKVRILAQVKKSVLTKKMTEVLPPQIFKVGRELQDAHAKIATQNKRNVDSAAILKNALSKLNPRDLIDVSLVSSTPFIRTEGKKTDKVYLHYLLKFEINMDKYKEFASVLDSALSQVSLDGTKIVRGVVERKENDRLKRVLNLDRFKSFDESHWRDAEKVFKGYNIYNRYNIILDAFYTVEIKMCGTKVSSDTTGAGSSFNCILLMDDMPKYSLCRMKGYSVNKDMATVLHDWACVFKPREGSCPFYYSMIFTGANGEELCLSQFSVAEQYLINLSSNQNSASFNIFPLIGGEATAYYKWVRCEIPAGALPEIKSLTIERTK